MKKLSQFAAIALIVAGSVACDGQKNEAPAEQPAASVPADNTATPPAADTGLPTDTSTTTAAAPAGTTDATATDTNATAAPAPSSTTTTP